MPRIQAATVAEHREQQRRALLDAARAILGETGRAPSMGTVATRAGLARTSVYQYFPSAEDLLAAVVADVFPAWARQVLDHVAAAGTPGERVWAYVEANLGLFASAEQAVAGALARVVEPHVLAGPMTDFHGRLQEPLLDALADLGEPEPTEMAEVVDSLVHQAARPFGALDTADRPAAQAAALARLRRLLGGYLRLDPAGQDG